MLTWTVIGITCGALATTGATIDRLLLRRTKTTIHLRLIDWWCRLDDLTIRNIAPTTARRTLGLLGGWRLFSWRFILASIVGSCILTSVANTIGSILDLVMDIDPWHDLLPPATLYATNYLCDLATFLVTWKALHILTHSSRLRGFLAVATDITVAVFLAFIAFSLNLLAIQYAVDHEWPGTASALEERNRKVRSASADTLVEYGFGEDAELRVRYRLGLGVIEHVQQAPAIFVGVLLSGEHEMSTPYEITATGNGLSRSYDAFGTGVTGWLWVLVASTTLIPTALYMSLLMLMVMGWAILRVVHLGFKLFLERATEDNPGISPEKFIPVTLLGLLFSTIALAAKAFVEIVSALRAAS